MCVCVWSVPHTDRSILSERPLVLIRYEAAWAPDVMWALKNSSLSGIETGSYKICGRHLWLPLSTAFDIFICLRSVPADRLLYVPSALQTFHKYTHTFVYLENSHEIHTAVFKL